MDKPWIIAAAVAITAASAFLTVTVAQADARSGPVLNGPILQGPILQGPLLQGPVLQGPILQGPDVSGVGLASPRIAVKSVTLANGVKVTVR